MRRPAARRAAPARPAAPILWPTPGTVLPEGPFVVSWEDVGADGYALLVGDEPGDSRYHGHSVWRAGSPPVMRGLAAWAAPHELVSRVVEGVPRTGGVVHLRLWSIWIGLPAEPPAAELWQRYRETSRLVDVAVRAHDARGVRAASRLERAASIALRLQPTGAPRARTMRRAAALERDIDAGPPAPAPAHHANWSDPHATRRARDSAPCRCPGVDLTVSAERWIAEGCPAHPGEPGRSAEADRRAARALLEARLRSAGAFE